MPGKVRNDRIRQDVTDISSPNQLLRYAMAGQLELLLGRGFKQGSIAQGAGFGTSSRNAGPALSRALKTGPTADQLPGLDEIIGTLNPDLDDTGSLSSLALRLSPERRDKIEGSILAARVPPSWTRKILADTPADEIAVLMQASALLSEFMAAGKMGSRDIVATIRDPLQQGDGTAGPAADTHLRRAAHVEESRRADLARHACQLRLEADDGPPGLPAAVLADGVPGLAVGHQACQARRGR